MTNIVWLHLFEDPRIGKFIVKESGREDSREESRMDIHCLKGTGLFYCLMGTEFLLRMIKCFGNSGDSCTVLWIMLMQLFT